MNVALIASEVAPFSKTGGLGDVTAALARALARAGHRAITVSPLYGTLDRRAVGARDTGIELGIPGAGVHHVVRFWTVDGDDGVHHVLIAHPMFERGGIYGDHDGSFGDNHLRYGVMSRAAIEAVRRVPAGGAPLGEDAVLHSHDWQAALVPVFLDALYRPLGLFPTAAVVHTVHNLAHQGVFAPERFDDLDLPPRWFAPWAIEHHGVINLLKGGMLRADQLTTVSPTFAREIQTSEGGFGLDGIVRHRSHALTGILNGIDPETWDPASDPHLTAHFDADDLTGKALCKGALQSELGLPVDARVPLVASVGRLDPQKGVELLIDSIDWLVREQGAQVVVLGSAQPAHAAYEEHLRNLEQVFPRNVRAWIGFNESLAHRIEAGADLFVMPSRFEPCGLNQMYSMRYGTVPVVRAVGGLADSVHHAAPDGSAGTGWRFDQPHGQALRDALWAALHCWRANRDAFTAIQQRGMRHDWSWDAVVPAYERVYERARAARG